MTIDIAALRALEKAAPPGPWMAIDGVVYTVENDKFKVFTEKIFTWDNESADFIAAARNALPELLDRVEHLMEANHLIRNEMSARWGEILRKEHASDRAEIERLRDALNRCDVNVPDLREHVYVTVAIALGRVP